MGWWEGDCFIDGMCGWRNERRVIEEWTERDVFLSHRMYCVCLIYALGPCCSGLPRGESVRLSEFFAQLRVKS